MAEQVLAKLCHKQWEVITDMFRSNQGKEDGQWKDHPTSSMACSGDSKPERPGCDSPERHGGTGQ